MRKRIFVRSGVEEEFDARQQRLLDHVLQAVERYYRDLHRTRSMYEQPLSLSILMRLTRRSGDAVLKAVRILANSVAEDERQPPLFYDRIRARHCAHRPYRIFLRSRP